MIQDRQKTLRRQYEFEGKGLHSGLRVRMNVAPAPAGTGIRFLRKDIGDDAIIEAVADYVTYTQRGTTLEKGVVKVSTIEHLLSALWTLGVDNALITLDTFEVPILDGSALPYAEAFAADGLEEQDAPRKYYTLSAPLYYRDEKTGAEVTISPSDGFSVDLSIDYGSRVLGIQKAAYAAGTDYLKEIAPCRTFVFFHELEVLFKNNLIKGGDLENAVVIVEHPVPQEDLARMAALFNVEKVERVPEGYLDNVKLHFDNECARHKLLDLLGDFALVGMRLKGHVTATRSGHRINTDVARILRKDILKHQ